MKYVGIQTQIRKNNLRSVYMLAGFPLLIVFLVWLFFFFYMAFANQQEMSILHPENVRHANHLFIPAIPWVIGVCALWFIIAYFSNVFIIKSSTQSESLSRKENMRVYNLIENLCISQGMQMPKINVIEVNALNAFASGINTKTYTITLTRGIIDTLNDEELEGVIAHELTHIQNKDVRLLIISIVFVGIFTFAAQILSRSIYTRNKNKAVPLIIIGLLIVGLGYVLSSLMRFGISRKREFMADAGAVQMTKNPHALASALRKISTNAEIKTVSNQDVAQLFIQNSQKKKGFVSLFASHPPIEKRIYLLEQF